ncbi:MAG: hypothetical protein AB7K37_02650 [Cyclobacteriaceae bacterium]
MTRLLVFLGSITLMVSCVNQPADSARAYFDFDSLVNGQINQLLAVNATISKEAQIDGKPDHAVYQPDSILWSHELEMFRDLNIINKPVNQHNYEVQDGLKDDNSNLLTRTLSARKKSQVQRLTFFYEGTPDRLRKIEADVREETTLYSTLRKLKMQFDNSGNKLLLSSYSIEGVQKIILKDSVRFAIHVEVVAGNPH